MSGSSALSLSSDNIASLESQQETVLRDRIYYDDIVVIMNGHMPVQFQDGEWTLIR